MLLSTTGSSSQTIGSVKTVYCYRSLVYCMHTWLLNLPQVRGLTFVHCPAIVDPLPMQFCTVLSPTRA